MVNKPQNVFNCFSNLNINAQGRKTEKVIEIKDIQSQYFKKINKVVKSPAKLTKNKSPQITDIRNEQSVSLQIPKTLKR